MKKMLFWAAMSAIALTSCVNDENLSGEKQDAMLMRFDAPAMMKTRANVMGEITGNSYAAAEDFTVFCKYYKNSFTGWGSTLGDYFAPEGSVAKNQGNASVYWATTETYYWPDIEYNLAFAAYSPAVMEPAPADIEHKATGLYVTDFKVNEAADKQFDLMYSDRVVDRNKTNNGTTSVKLLFHHALSSIVFSSAKDATDDVEYIITEVSLHGNLVQQADFDQNITDEVAGTADPQWINHDAAAQVDYSPSFGGSFEVTSNTPTQFTKGESAILLIPQVIPDDAYVSVVYTKDGLGHTATIPLNQFSKDGDPNSTTGKITEWEMGKRYVYRIAFGQNMPIYFEPSTSDWVQEPTLIYTIK